MSTKKPAPAPQPPSQIPTRTGDSISSSNNIRPVTQTKILTNHPPPPASEPPPRRK